jgi:phenylalanine-4-hydroxylase
MQGHACEEHIKGLELLQLSPKQIPQLPDVSAKLRNATGWRVSPVKALITAKEFFNLLAHRQFPAATFIRRREEIDYVQEPDIFHELFGHCPMLTEPVFADFVQRYAQMVLQIDEAEWPLLQRLFWFTNEFGLIKTSDGQLRSYGGGILSSYTETIYAVESPLPKRQPFNVLEILRTPYRIDLLQTSYFVINDYHELFQLITSVDELKDYIRSAHELGEYPPTFPVDKGNPSIHINAC